MGNALLLLVMRNKMKKYFAELALQSDITNHVAKNENCQAKARENPTKSRLH